VGLSGPRTVGPRTVGVNGPRAPGLFNRAKARGHGGCTPPSPQADGLNSSNGSWPRRRASANIAAPRPPDPAPLSDLKFVSGVPGPVRPARPRRRSHAMASSRRVRIRVAASAENRTVLGGGVARAVVV
jgi:hypothetical protein